MALVAGAESAASLDLGLSRALEGTPSSFRAFDAVLFDIDGTLVDSIAMVTAGLGDMVERYAGYRPDDAELRALIGMPLLEQARMFRPDADDATHVAMAAYAMERYRVHEHLESPFEEAILALRDVHAAGVPIALVTSKSDVELAAFLLRFEPAPLVGTAVTATDVARGKPDPEGVLLACRRLGVAPERAVFIGDSRYDVLAGRAAGTTTVGLLYGAGDRASLEAAQPDELIETPRQLREWIAARLR